MEKSYILGNSKKKKVLKYTDAVEEIVSVSAQMSAWERFTKLPRVEELKGKDSIFKEFGEQPSNSEYSISKVKTVLNGQWPVYGKFSLDEALGTKEMRMDPGRGLGMKS